jgi:hypothetical protein
VTVSVSGSGAPMRMAKLVVSSSKLPFGSVTIGTSADQTLTLTNTGDADLSVFEIGSANPLAAPFALAAGQDGCSNQTLSPESSCTVVVRYSPTDEETRNDSFDIPSTDPDDRKLTVSVSGSGLPSTANNPPASPALVFPADGMEGLPTTVTFSWDESSDPDGETVTYDLYYCENSSFEGCAPLEVAAFWGSHTPRVYAGFGGIGFLVFVFFFGVNRRKRSFLLLTMLVTSLTLLSSCGWAPGDEIGSLQDKAVHCTVEGLNGGTTYYWKVVASDGVNSTESAVRTFTTS